MNCIYAGHIPVIKAGINHWQKLKHSEAKKALKKLKKLKVPQVGRWEDPVM